MLPPYAAAKHKLQLWLNVAQCSKHNWVFDQCDVTAQQYVTVDATACWHDPNGVQQQPAAMDDCSSSSCALHPDHSELRQLFHNMTSL
jgi:hypothetical protein